MKNINVITIGSGSTGNCFYIEMNDYSFLIDMGMGYRITKNILEKNYRNLENVLAIFVTHGHSDHIKANIAIGNHTRCGVYADSSCMYSIREMQNIKVPIEIDKEFEPMPGLYAKAFPVSHDYYRTCGYTFRYEDCKVGYVTDCGKMHDYIIDELAGSDLVIIESNHDVTMLKNGPYPYYLQDRILSEYGHLSNDECASTIKKLYDMGTRHFMLAHISKNNNTPQLAFNTTNDLLNKEDAHIYVCPEIGDELIEI